MKAKTKLTKVNPTLHFPLLMHWNAGDNKDLIVLFTDNDRCIVIDPGIKSEYNIGESIKDCCEANSGDWKIFEGEVILSN